MHTAISHHFNNDFFFFFLARRHILNEEVIIVLKKYCRQKLTIGNYLHSKHRHHLWVNRDNNKQ